MKGLSMKRIVTRVLALLLAVGVLAPLAACASQSIDVSKVTAIIDVRTAQEYATGHVQGALNFDVESSDFATEISGLDKNGYYVLYCHSGRRAGIALDEMKAAGFTHVVNAGGYQDAADETKLPIVTN